MATAFRLHDVPPRQGLRWVGNAFRCFFARPMALSSLFLAFLLAGLLLLAVPLVGSVLLMAALPLLTLGYMIATRSALAGGPAHPGQLVLPLRRDAAEPARRRALLVLCGLYALATVLIVLLSDMVDGGRFDQLQVLLATGEGKDAQAQIEALLADPRLRGGLMLRFGLATLLSIPFWHAPALVWWGGQGVAQSLFSSTLAVWRTKGAFAIYALAWGGVVLLFGLMAGVLFSLLGARQLIGAAALPAGLMFTAVFYVSLYFSFVDTFGPPD